MVRPSTTPDPWRHRARTDPRRYAPLALRRVRQPDRFDVTRTRRTTEFWHFDLAGDHVVEEETVREESVESVSCRWCGRDDAIELVARNEAGIDPHEQG